MRCAVIGALLFASGVSMAISQELSPAKLASIHIRVVRTETLQPVAKFKVSVASFHSPETMRHQVTLRTDSSGAAAVPLSLFGGTPPERLAVNVAYGNWTQCSPRVFVWDEIVLSGVVAANKCESNSKGTSQIHADPGELVVFIKHISPREKLRHFPG